MNKKDPYKNSIINLIFILSSIFFSITAIEIFTRLYYGIPLFELKNYVVSELDFLKHKGSTNIYDPILGWRQRPGTIVDAPGNDNIIHIGEHSIRMNSNKIEQIKNGGILAVGDSFTFGSGVNNNETWPAHLETISKQKVINAGAGGYGVDQIILNAEELIDKIKPRKIIIMILSQDIIRNSFSIFGGSPKPYFTVENNKLIPHNIPVPISDSIQYQLGFIQSRFGYLYSIHRIMSNLNLEWWINGDNRNIKVLSTEEGVESSCALLDSFMKKNNNIEILLGFTYGGSEVSSKYQPPFVRPVINCATESGYKVLDMWDILISKDLSELKRIYIMHYNQPNPWGHPSSYGNQLIAQEINKLNF